MFRNIEGIYKANRALLTVSPLRKTLVGQPDHVALETEGNRHKPLITQGSRRSLDEMGMLARYSLTRSC